MALIVNRGAALSEEISRAGDHAVVELVGELDLSTAGLLYQHLAELNHEGVNHVAIDLAGLEFLGSVGISALVSEHKRTTAMKGELILLYPQPQVRKVLEIAGLMDILKVYPKSSNEG